jgi:dTDP-4-dehydrorhamnose reductase
MSIRIAVTGRHGQVARALNEAGPQLGVEIAALGRPLLIIRPRHAGRPTLGSIAASSRARASHRTAILAFLTEELPGTSEQRS